MNGIRFDRDASIADRVRFLVTGASLVGWVIILLYWYVVG